jgi:hypothetical protein
LIQNNLQIGTDFAGMAPEGKCKGNVMSLKSLSFVGSAACALLIGGVSAVSADVMLPTPSCGLSATNNCLTFSDFTVYSLALLNFQAGAGDISPGDPFQVASNGSSIANSIVIGSSDANAKNNQDIPSIAGKVDNAFDTPTGAGSALTNFQMTVAAEPAPTFIGDISGVWNIQVAALQSYLNGGQLQFFFNLNQTASGNSYLGSGEDALAALYVTLSKTGGGSVSFALNGNNCGSGVGSCVPGVQSFAQTAANNILPSANDQWAYIHGKICVNNAGAVLGFGSCNSLGISGNTVNQNLGANTAAFAIVSDGLNSALNSGAYDILSVDLRMAALDNGFEQLFIQAGPAKATVPEPTTLSIFGGMLALLAFGTMRRRRTMKA